MGPWTYNATSRVRVDDARGEVVALVYGSDEAPIEKVGALISAAPDLYGALAAVVDEVPAGKISIAARVALDNARAALAKARGETP